VFFKLNVAQQRALTTMCVSEKSSLQFISNNKKKIFAEIVVVINYWMSPVTKRVVPPPRHHGPAD